MKKLVILAAAAMMSSFAMAQKGVEDGSAWGHGQDSVDCILANVRYVDAFKMKDYAGAYPDWLKLFNDAPLCKGKKSAILYSQGVTIIKSLYAKEKDAAKKEELYNMLLKTYDQRMKYYGDNANYPTTYLQGMRALDMLQFKAKDAATQQEANDLLAASLTGAAKTIQPAFTAKYMENAVELYKAGTLNAEQVVKVYLAASDAVKAIEKIQTDKNAQQIADCKTQVEQRFATSGAADCETIAAIFGPQLNDNTENIEWLKLINRLLDKGDCTDSELFYATSEYMHKIEPAASSARGLAKMYMKKNDNDKAISYYQEAISLENEDEAKKAQYYLELSAAYFSSNEFGKAREAAYNAAKLREGWGDPYLMLGRIYAAGAKQVGSEDWEKRAGYWAAVDKFAKAKSVDDSERIQKDAAELIRTYSQYFPNKEDLFMHGQQDGQSYKVGGFINETTTIRSKK